MPRGWSKVEPIPILQWLVVIVLAVHILFSRRDAVGSDIGLFIVSALVANAALLYGLPRLVPLGFVAAALVITDSVLVPVSLYLSGSTHIDVFVVFFSIIMIAAASGTLQQSLVLSGVACLAYIGYLVFVAPQTAPLEIILLRIPFFLVMTLFYGSLGEYAQRERREKERLAYAAMHDELTGMPNRRFILATLARELDEAKRFGSPLSCAVMDVDHFKQINDTYGHDVGDAMLKQYGSLLATQTRGYDLAGRLGGDEFIWVLPRAPREEARTAAERFRKQVEQFEFTHQDLVLRLTTSIGIASYTPADTPLPRAGQIFKWADLALYEAKRNGRNRVYDVGPSEVTLVPAGDREPGQAKTG